MQGHMGEALGSGGRRNEGKIWMRAFIMVVVGSC